MRKLIVVALFALAACRGEPVPRDYQNAPPDVGNAAQSKTDTPAQHGLGDAPPQPSTANEGTAGPYEPMTTDGGTATSLPDTPPTTTT